MARTATQSSELSDELPSDSDSQKDHGSGGALTANQSTLVALGDSHCVGVSVEARLGALLQEALRCGCLWASASA